MMQWYHICHFELYEQRHCFQGSDMIRHMRSGKRTGFVQAREKVEYIDSFQTLSDGGLLLQWRMQVAAAVLRWKEDLDYSLQ